MKKEVTAADMHALLKKNLFADVDLSQVASMTNPNLDSFTLAQADAIFGQQPYGDAMGWLIDKFLNDDGSKRLDNPLYAEHDALTNWYLALVELGADLYFHHSFDLNKLQPGLAQGHDETYEDFTIENTALVAWLRETPFRHVAAMVARIMLDLEFTHVVRQDDAIQDYYAENCDTSFFDVQDIDKCNAFVEAVLRSIETVKKHCQRGRELGLDDEQRRVVDILWSWVPHDYEQAYVDAGKEVVEAVNASLPDKTFIRSEKGFDAYRKQVMPSLVKIVEKYELGVDLTDQYNLTIGYLNDWLYRKYMGDLLQDGFFD